MVLYSIIIKATCQIDVQLFPLVTAARVFFMSFNQCSH